MIVIVRFELNQRSSPEKRIAQNSPNEASGCNFSEVLRDEIE